MLATNILTIENVVYQHMREMIVSIGRAKRYSQDIANIAFGKSRPLNLCDGNTECSLAVLGFRF